MNVNAIVTRLDTQVSALAQVISATPGGSQTPVDTSTSLVTLLKSLVSSRMHPVTIRDYNTHPSIVYQLVSSTSGRIDGYQVTQTDTFVLFIRHTSYDSLITLVNSVVAAIDASTSSIEVTDILFDYDSDQQAYRCNMEVEYTVLMSSAQTLPSAYVYTISRSASESVYDNYVKQLVTNTYGIIVVNNTESSPVVTMDSLLSSIMSALLGWQQGAAFHEFQYSSGSSVEGVGGLEIWREIYTDGEYISQS